MPRALDVEDRRAAIVLAAVRLLASHGSRGLTMKALAEALGGSTTLITHIYPRKSDIYEGILLSLEEEAAQTLSELEPGTDARTGLRAFLRWCMPMDRDAAEEERLRLALLDQADRDPRIKEFLDRMEARMLSLFRRQLAPLVAPDELDNMAGLFRAMTNGGVLGAIEHPEEWTQRRQLAVIDKMLDAFIPASDPPMLTRGRRSVP